MQRNRCRAGWVDRGTAALRCPTGPQIASAARRDGFGTAWPKSPAAWQAEFERLEKQLPSLDRFRGHLGHSPAALAAWFEEAESVNRSLGLLAIYASMNQAVDATDQAATFVAQKL